MPTPDSITLYHFAGCPYCARVEAALRSLELPAELLLERRDIHRDAKSLTALVEATGRKTVPVLEIETAGQTRWLPESTAIIRYLYREYGNGKTPSWTLWVTWQHALLAAAVVALAIWAALG